MCTSLCTVPATCVLCVHTKGLVPVSRPCNMSPSVCRPFTLGRSYQGYLTMSVYFERPILGHWEIQKPVSTSLSRCEEKLHNVSYEPSLPLRHGWKLQPFLRSMSRYSFVRTSRWIVDWRCESVEDF